MDLISRQAAIDTEGLDEQIRCEMCRNPMKTDRGCDGNCKYDEKLYESIMQILDGRMKPLPSAQPEQKWIPFKSRPLTEEEKEDHPEWDFILDGKVPEDGQRILVNVKYRGHEAVQYDEYYDDDGCYLDSGYEIGTEVTAWMPLPKPYGGEPK